MPVAERRLVSVLFVDLVGSTALAADRDPEDTREMLSRYFDMARRVVERHGGTVEKFIGDAVMAVWGAPVAHEDDAVRAVRAALQLVAAVGTLSDGGVTLQARGGVLTGEAAVTIGAEGQGMVAGDLVNMASRLQSAADPGTVLVGEPTYRAASETIRFEAAGEKTMKGKAEPVATWRAVEVVAVRGGDRRAAAVEPPFVGREDELRQIKELFEATSRERRPRLVSVIGQAGIGKSRLAWEFEKYLDGVVETVYWYEGRSPAYGEGISYWALAEMVRRRARIAETDNPDEARARLSTMLDTLLPDAAERRWLEPRLAGLLGLADLPEEGREELFAAWRTYFERIAEAGPTVIVFADAHWADQGLLDFVEFLLSWSRSSPIFALVLARPELTERRPDWGNAVRSVTRITLEPLSNDQMTRLLDGTLPGLDADTVRRIVGRSEGIPLYAVETVRMLLDTGAVEEQGGRYAVTGDISQLAVAETLQALIAARLDAALPEDRALLQGASVLGQSFTKEALQAVLSGDPAVVPEQLDRLVRRQLLVRDDDPRSPERGQYRFIQSLVREVAYQSLAKPDRRSRHLAAARYFETLDDDELAGVLATHYLEAYRASRAGAEADALAGQARIALSAAAERAAALHSHAQAVAYVELALSVTADQAEQAELHMRASESGEFAADMLGAMQHAATAHDLFRAVGDRRGMLRASALLGQHQTSYHNEADAVETLRGAIREAESLGDVPELAAVLAELSRVLMLTEQDTDAVETADRALAVSGEHDLLQPTVEALINRGSSLPRVGRRHEAEAVLRGVIELADAHGLIRASLRARNNLLSSRVTDRVDESMQLARDGQERAERYGHRTFVYQFAFEIALLEFEAGDWDRILPEIDAVQDPDSPARYPFYEGAFAGIRATLACARGDQALSDRESARLAEIGQQLQSRQMDAFASVTNGQIALLRGQWDAAIRECLSALENDNTVSPSSTCLIHAAVAANRPQVLTPAAEALGDLAARPELSSRFHVAAGQAGMAARAGRWDEARVGYRAALEGLRDYGALFQWALTCLDWGALAADHNPEAAEALRQGREFFAERGSAARADAYLSAFVPVEAPRGASGAEGSRSGAAARSSP
jgi:class 3 adenylate cyclase/tetratricopeptide (TPR) repeat protein